MKLKLLLRTAVLLVCIVSLTQCKKEVEALLNPKSTLTVVNPTFTTMDISVNGEIKTIAAGGSAVFSGTPGVDAIGSASTSGKTTTGAQVGSLMTWNILEEFPASGDNLNLTLNVGADYFFLKLINQSLVSIQKVYVNYGLVSQTVDNISIPNTGGTYNLGYYRAYSNSNVRAESGSSYWYWNPLGLPYTNNQSKTLTAL